jgi:hypothetical protein
VLFAGSSSPVATGLLLRRKASRATKSCGLPASWIVKLSSSRSWHLVLPSEMQQQKVHGNNDAGVACYVGHMGMRHATKA